MRTITKEQIEAALDSLNAQYGRGDVVHVQHFAKKVRIKKQYGTEVVPFRIERRTVFFRGHQKTILKVEQYPVLKKAKGEGEHYT